MNHDKSTRPTVLVVDDRRENLIAMRHTLAKLDSNIVCVDNGNDALKQLLHNQVAVILLDVQMPDMDGFETAALIRGNEATLSLPIIFVTAINKEKRFLEQGYQLGAVDYLCKPFDPHILQCKVSVFLELFQQRQRFLALARKNQLILESVQEGVLGLDARGKVIFSNPAAAKLLGMSMDELNQQCITHFISKEKNASWHHEALYTMCQQEGGSYRTTSQFLPANSAPIPVECTTTIMRDDEQTLAGFVLVFDDISARIQAEKQLEHMAEYDSLTGLANRRLFYRLLPKLLAKANRLDHKLALLFLDVDHFKTINDTFGHVVGDLLLSQVARRISQCVRESDTVVRLSGDEFTVVLEGEIDQQGAETVAANIVSSMARPFELHKNQIHCSVSVGIALAPDVSREANELIKAADTAMYNAKTQGRNSYQFYDEILNHQVSFRSNVETQIPGALANNEFQLVYQPKVTLTDGQLIGFESLLRWQSPALGWVRPDISIPVAEDSGHIHELGYWILRQANAQLSQWSQQGNINNDFRLSVNFSIKQLNAPNFLEQFKRVIAETSIDPQHLDVEITESTLLSSPDAVVPLLHTLSDMGMTISVDDFGTGYCSLSYLNLLPIDNLKIDRSFIRDLFHNKNSEIITRSIINLAHNLGLRVVAEGVETQQQRDFLQFHQCDYGQGYLYGKPMQAKDAMQCLARP